MPRAAVPTLTCSFSSRMYRGVEGSASCMPPPAPSSPAAAGPPHWPLGCAASLGRPARLPAIGAALGPGRALPESPAAACMPQLAPARAPSAQHSHGQAAPCDRQASKRRGGGASPARPLQTHRRQTPARRRRRRRTLCLRPPSGASWAGCRTLQTCGPRGRGAAARLQEAALVRRAPLRTCSGCALLSRGAAAPAHLASCPADLWDHTLMASKGRPCCLPACPAPRSTTSSWKRRPGPYACLWGGRSACPWRPGCGCCCGWLLLEASRAGGSEGRSAAGSGAWPLHQPSQRNMLPVPLLVRSTTPAAAAAAAAGPPGPVASSLLGRSLRILQRGPGAQRLQRRPGSGVLLTKLLQQLLPGGLLCSRAFIVVALRQGVGIRLATPRVGVSTAEAPAAARLPCQQQRHARLPWGVWCPLTGGSRPATTYPRSSSACCCMMCCRSCSCCCRLRRWAASRRFSCSASQASQAWSDVIDSPREQPLTRPGRPQEGKQGAPVLELMVASRPPSRRADRRALAPSSQWRELHKPITAAGNSSLPAHKQRRRQHRDATLSDRLPPGHVLPTGQQLRRRQNNEPVTHARSLPAGLKGTCPPSFRTPLLSRTKGKYNRGMQKTAAAKQYIWVESFMIAAHAAQAHVASNPSLHSRSCSRCSQRAQCRRLPPPSLLTPAPASPAQVRHAPTQR
jgi:hypothetical protein